MSLVVWFILWLVELLYEVIQLIRYWLYGASALIKPSLNRPTSGAARTKKLHSLPLTLSISKTGKNASGMNGNNKICYLSVNLLKVVCDTDIIKHILSILLQKLKSSPLIQSSKSISLLRKQILSEVMGNSQKCWPDSLLASFILWSTLALVSNSTYLVLLQKVQIFCKAIYS